LGYFDIPVDHIYGQVVRVLSLQCLIWMLHLIEILIWNF
jgi:hypothetical protein